MNRITPEQVKEAYAKTGLKPEIGHATVVNGKCCAVGAIGVANGADGNETYDIILVFEGITGPGYRNSFSAGFDRWNWKADEIAEWRDTPGFDDGIACAAAVFGASP